MRIPDALRSAIENELRRNDLGASVRVSDQLTRRYKSGDYTRPVLETAQSRAAYLIGRLPATFAANVRVFTEIVRLHEEAGIKSVLDLGAGPGTSMWAAAEVFHAIERFTLVERDSEMIETGRRLASSSPVQAVRSARWLRQDLAANLADADPHDLVTLSYALGEISLSEVESVIRSAWARASQYLVIVEPGTPRNFERIVAARNILIDLHAHIVAPCPHALQCPLAAADDWCHFSQRLDRTSGHRQIKGGTLGYEDEKFSYLIFSKSPLPLPDRRIVRHPLKHKGHVQIELCTPQGVLRVTVTKSMQNYKVARTAKWGDAWKREHVQRAKDDYIR